MTIVKQTQIPDSQTTGLRRCAGRQTKDSNRVLTEINPEATQEKPTGSILEGEKVIVIEQTDTFERHEFTRDNVPSTLIDENASVGGRTALNRSELEEFLDRNLSSLKGGLLSRMLGRK